MNDTDILTAEITERANMAHAGICVECEEPLDPCHPKWAGQFDTQRRIVEGVIVDVPWSPEQEAAFHGPALDWAPYHKDCMEAMDHPHYERRT